MFHIYAIENICLCKQFWASFSSQLRTVYHITLVGTSNLGLATPNLAFTTNALYILSTEVVV